ncbi:hypothetical protein, partial [Porphyromonas gingivalis]|uniref:hypothetical protein n=1 Tax=Porphyromonas gingivalis TaxID=837 RepID=UPI001C5481E8
MAKLHEERQTISALLRDNGYYYFRPQDIIYEADIDTNHEKCQIVAKADTGAESDAIQEIAHRSHFGQSTART